MMQHEERLKRIWTAMNARCKNKKDSDYGGRGIQVCERWSKRFLDFFFDNIEEYTAHVDEHGEKNTSIDRIDFNGNYEPSNVRWATSKIQNNNRRERVTNNGGGKRTMTLKIKSGEDFKNILAKKGYTQETYAEKMDISFSHLNKSINGKKNLGAKLAHKIQKDLKVKFDELFIIETEEMK